MYGYGILCTRPRPYLFNNLFPRKKPRDTEIERERERKKETGRLADGHKTQTETYYMSIKITQRHRTMYQTVFVESLQANKFQR